MLIAELNVKLFDANRVKVFNAADQVKALPSFDRASVASQCFVVVTMESAGGLRACLGESLQGVAFCACSISQPAVAAPWFGIAVYMRGRYGAG